MVNDYWPLFEKFCRAEMATGGPDPQIATILKITEEDDMMSRVWMAGCYGSHHCVSSAAAVYKAWNPYQVIAQPGVFRIWLKKHWDYLPVRPEMRSHRMLEKRHKCLTDFAVFSQNYKEWYSMTNFEHLWNHSINSVKYFGRYMAIKFMEIGHRGGWFIPEMPDMRARGAWSPKRALGLLYPDVPSLSNREDSTEIGYRIMENHATKAIDKLAEAGIKVNYFSLQVMLCEFREALDGTYYPGASLDEELAFIRLTEERFDMQAVKIARRKLFKPEHLGEVSGWPGLRKEKFKEFK